MNGIHLEFTTEVEEAAVEQDRLVQVESSSPQKPKESAITDDIRVLRHSSKVISELLSHRPQLPFLLGAPSVIHPEDTLTPGC